MHSASIERGESYGGACRGIGARCVTTRACSTIPSKRDGENTVEEGKACDLKRGVFVKRKCILLLLRVNDIYQVDVSDT